MDLYYPGKQFPSLSVTGEECSLSCPHCEKKYLKGMVAVETPEKLIEISYQLQKEGGNGFLLSGGCDPEGKVPLHGYYKALKKIKEDTDLKINVHTGLADGEMARSLSDSKIDVVSYDVIGSAETIEYVYGLEKTPKDFKKGYDLLKKEGLKVAPHITVGLHDGELKGDFKSVKMVEGTDVLVLNSLIPSEFGKRVKKEDFLSVLDHGLSHIDGKIILGCMRERGRSDMEIEALKRGVDGMVIPSRETVKWARSHLDIEKHETCCVF